jgi:hypothetical protein
MSEKARLRNHQWAEERKTEMNREARNAVTKQRLEKEREIFGPNCHGEELEPFIRAAELGCKDFEIEGGVQKRVFFWLSDSASYWLPSAFESSAMNERINRYAAAVCAEWWATQTVPVVHDPRFQQKHLMEKQQMIELCRAFARKHGGQ